MPSWLLSYKVQLFSLTELPFEGMCCLIFHLLGLVLLASRNLCLVRLLFGDLAYFFSRTWSPLIDQPSVTSGFQLKYFFPNYLWHSSLLIFLVIKLPSVYYLLCDQVAYVRSILHT
jgi:hypothetical protein